MKEYKTTVSVKLLPSMIEALDKVSGKEKGKKFGDRSDAIRVYIERGMQFENLLEIYNDPKRRQDFEEKLSGIAKAKDFEKYAATIDDPGMIDSMIFVLTNQKDSRIKQLLLEVKNN